MKTILSAILLLLSNSVFSFSKIEGNWRGSLKLNDSIDVPFHFSIRGDTFTLLNQAEKLSGTEIQYSADSVFIHLPVFDTELRFKINEKHLNGYFINNTRKFSAYIPCTAEYEVGYRFFDKPERASVNFTGRYDVHFQNEDAEGEHAVGIFNQDGNYITGTFLTTTGDYRFLEGDVAGDQFFLSTFDGSHVFYFYAKMIGDSLINGQFFSSLTWHDEWTGKKNPKAALPDAESFITYKQEPLHFSFPDENGNMISIDDDRFKNRPVILQLMGSWCPNCMDESRFLAPWYLSKKNKIEVLALDFERITDTARVNKTIKRLKKQLGINYTMVFAGSADKKEAAKLIPQLNRIFAFPTLIILNKHKQIVVTHSGFSGPATGEEYEKFIRWFEKMVARLLAE